MTPIRLRPSHAGMWVKCPASAQAVARYPEIDDSGDVREDGIKAHALAHALFNGLPFNEPVTDEMRGYITEYVDYLRGLGGTVVTEQRVEVPGIGGGILDAESDDGDCVTVVDLKYGFNPVSAEENWQLACYAKPRGDNRRFRFVIYQPRLGGPPSIWEPTVGELRAMWDTLDRRAYEARLPQPPAHTGPHCAKCPGRHECSALKNVVSEVLSLVETVEFDPHTPADAGRELSILRQAQTLLTARITGIESAVQHMISTGVDVPGWRMESGRGTVRWTVDVDKVRLLGQLSGLNLLKPAEPITPKQAIKAGVPEEVVNNVSEHIPGKTTLTPVKGIGKWLNKS